MPEIVQFRIPSSQSWTRQAACAGDDAPLMFPHEKNQAAVTMARSVCARCPVRRECLEAAIDSNETYGIWGGLTYEERLKVQS